MLFGELLAGISLVGFMVENFAPAEQNAIVIWGALSTKYPKFLFGDPSLKAPGEYVFDQYLSCRSLRYPVIASVSVGEYISLKLHVVPAEINVDLSVGQWSWSAADPRSLDEFFMIMDGIYEGFHQFREGQALQLGGKVEDNMLDRDQTARKLYMTAADILGVQYHRQFIIGLQNELNNPEFIQAMKQQTGGHILLQKFARIGIF